MLIKILNFYFGNLSVKSLIININNHHKVSVNNHHVSLNCVMSFNVIVLIV